MPSSLPDASLVLVVPAAPNVVARPASMGATLLGCLVVVLLIQWHTDSDVNELRIIVGQRKTNNSRSKRSSNHHQVLTGVMQQQSGEKPTAAGRPTARSKNMSSTGGAQHGKERLIQLLQDAEIEVDDEILEKLPTWEEVVHLYGNTTILYGGTNRQACQHFRNNVPSSVAFLAPAGIFNTGTNAMAAYLEANCKMPNHEGNIPEMQWEVPWGKHMFASQRLNQTRHPHIVKDHVLPIVMIRDPYFWIQSTCHHRYILKWTRDVKRSRTGGHPGSAAASALCPDMALVAPTGVDNWTEVLSAGVVEATFGNRSTEGLHRKWDSLVHLWNDWNSEYFRATTDFPRIMVRFEDLVFRPQQLIQEICECGGGVMTSTSTSSTTKFQYQTQSQKRGSHTSMLTALMTYGSRKHRREGFTPLNLKFIASVVDQEIMEAFGYSTIVDYD